jgi:hypothetical protein
MLCSPIELWEEFKDDMAQDILHQHRLTSNDLEAEFTNHVYNKCLIQNENKLLTIGGHSLHSYGLPNAIRGENENYQDIEYQRELNYNPEEETEAANSNILINAESRTTFTL